MTHGISIADDNNTKRCRGTFLGNLISLGECRVLLNSANCKCLISPLDSYDGENANISEVTIVIVLVKIAESLKFLQCVSH
jgi:hypothetical protein